MTVDLGAPAPDCHSCLTSNILADGRRAAGVLYLGHYLYRRVISERDVLRCHDGQVTYRWRDAKSGKPATQPPPHA